MNQPSACLIGCGNIGSAALPLLVRLGVSRLLLVDPGRYDEGNLISQNITVHDIGRPKVHVQADRARSIRPSIDITCHHARVEDVPLTLLRADVLFACVDSRLARQSINRIAFRLAIPWIDSAVDAGFGLARVAVYIPGSGACIECGWCDDDYGLLEIEQPCDASGDTVPATNAPAYLGSLAAAFQLAALDSLQRGAVVGGVQMLVHPQNRRLSDSVMPRNPQCRFDHDVWDIGHLGCPATTRVRELLPGASSIAGGQAAGLRIEDDGFALSLICLNCSHEIQTLRRVKRLTPIRCPLCDEQMLPPGHAVRDLLGVDDLRGANPTLSDVGIQTGDVLSVFSPDVVRHYAVGA